MKQNIKTNIDLEGVWKNYSDNNAAKLFDLTSQKIDPEKEGLCPVCGEVMQKKRGSETYSEKNTNKKYDWTVYPLDGNKDNVQVENLQPVHAACAEKLDEAPKTLETWKNVQVKIAPAKAAPVAPAAKGKKGSKKAASQSVSAEKLAPAKKAPAKKAVAKPAPAKPATPAKKAPAKKAVAKK